ncbi:MAG: inositol monophosphatase [Candidatus Omnitrophica bacterium]|nr:inositol monophosphatase [Candidatus Omnitrophota bacterium]
MKTAKIKSVLFQALEETGKLLKNSLHERNVTAKKSELSIVTATDMAAEKIILDLLKKEFPDHSILSEESPAMGTAPQRWIIDPIDGTTNFAHTYPIACISIAYEEYGVVQLGGVYDPFRDELFFAERGQGASLNGSPIRVSGLESIGDALVATGFPYDRRKDPDSYLAIVRAFMMKVQGIRRSGSAAIDLCYVACGRLDGYWETKLKPWDMAAASLMVEEAGGKLSDYSGGPFGLENIQILASNSKLHADMLEIIEPYKNIALNQSI